MRALLIFTESPFSKRDYERFGVSYLAKNFAVKIIDCTPWLQPKVWKLYFEIAYSCDGYITISSKSEVAKLLADNYGFIAIDNIGNSRNAEWIRRKLHCRGAIITRLLVGLIPLPSTKISFLRKIINLTQQPRRLLKTSKTLILRIISKQAVEADVVILGGDAGLNIPWVQRIPYKVSAHSFDYDIFLQTKNFPNEHKSNYAVFLDSDIVHHSDFVHLGLKPPISEEEYYPLLHKFFDNVEEKLGIQVIFAVHPRSRYGLKPKLLNGRPYIIGQTATLVRDAQLVFLHASTAQSFAVLWKKPMVFLTSNKLATSSFGPIIEHHAKSYKKNVVNLNSFHKDAIKQEEFFSIDEPSYRDYRQLYLKTKNSPDRPFWEIFSDYIHDAGV